MCHAAMLRERITEGQALSAVRAGGGGDWSEAETLIQESDGTISVVLNAR